MLPSDRFWAKVDKAGQCWNWTAATTHDGYGRFKVAGATVCAHRWAYEQIVGDIAEGLQLDNLCRNRRCVNPEHLEPVTCRENLLRGNTLQADNATKTHCKHGHEFTPENIIARGERGRECRECNRQRSREYQRGRAKVSRNTTA
ncbi:HNH endonuclease signature motif containing protein [Nonomuraea sp. NPDC049646]|uniref:HNH endonuclease signature motif containing protein n=1 Tax=unclassified Nonomuraea TaxID=2593643 RepID=UPI0037B0E54E